MSFLSAVNAGLFAGMALRRRKLSWTAAYALALTLGLLIALFITLASLFFGGPLRNRHPRQEMIFWAAGAALGAHVARARRQEITTLNLSGREPE